MKVKAIVWRASALPVATRWATRRGEHACLARARAGDDRDERRLGGDRASLVVVEISQQGLWIHAAKVLSRAMPYPKKLLNDFETVALDLHPHWSFFAKAVVGLVASVVFGIVVRVFVDGDAEMALTWLAIVLILLSVMWVIGRYAKWSTTNFVITSDRVIYRSGVVAKSGIEIPLERVNTVLSSQGVIERMLGTGDLLIESAGETGQQRFTDIKSPSRVQNLIHAQREANSARMHSGAVVTDIPTQLEKLEGLLERGSITDAEFEQQKRRILNDS